MQKIVITLLVGLILGGAAVFFFLQQPQAQTVPADGKTSFESVTSQLDGGGILYAYLSTEGLVKAVDKLLIRLKTLVAEQAGSSEKKKEQIAKSFDFVHGLIQKSGVMDISGVGVSTKKIENNLNHTRFVLHHYPGDSDGLIWKLMEPTPQPLEDLDWLPGDTVFSLSTALRLKTLWNWLKTEAEASPIPEMKKAVLSVEPALQAQGIDLERLLDSVSGRFAFFITLDGDKKNSLPINQQLNIEIPEPGLALWITVRDDTLFKLIQTKLTFAQPVEGDEHTLRIPVPPMPIPFEPVIQQRADRLIIASHEQVLAKMDAAKKSGQNLRSNSEFKKLSKYTPSLGNDYRFVSRRLFQTFFTIQKQVTNGLGVVDTPSTMIWEEMGDFLPEGLAMFSVLQNTDTGFVYTANHTVGLEDLMLVPLSALSGMIGPISESCIGLADGVAKQNQTLAAMKQIAVALEMFRTKTGELPEGTSLNMIRAQLEPEFIASLPLTDGWGFPFHYKLIAEGAGYAIGSGGQDGVFLGFEQRGLYAVEQNEDLNLDIVMVDGDFIFSPEPR